jgi:isocitrate dehydrogenase (NAD+)
MSTTITLIPGDGIGPSVMDATLEVLEAAGADLEYDRQLAGMAAVHEVANPLPPRPSSRWSGPG